ncbi:hypothetical protein F9C07_2539 [Aspergillus flavus]|uniref:Protein argonaute N-terminal domain-containing protein n=1 Tax=Aspergillus flavus (strain ATCC 200026 / FGSC A1120 / IAM 13836 / NRRL 3357 / JCM 12722 / SRRC 167) TaxID=332952 RepID=A0A7U2MF76_ASPFN|nr:hypothetical protein F9C07_2539 [Aspergillus flavus]
MEEFEVVNKLTGGLRHLRVREADEVVKYSVPVETVPRPGFNTTGKEVDISLNAYPITKFPSRNVYQYDVNIGNGDEKNIVCKKVWNSNSRKTALKQIVYDGRKLAWYVP